MYIRTLAGPDVHNTKAARTLTKSPLNQGNNTKVARTITQAGKQQHQGGATWLVSPKLSQKAT